MDIFYGYVKPNLVLFLSLAAWKMTTDDKLYQGRCLSPQSAFITERSPWEKSGPVLSSSFGRLSQRPECCVYSSLFMSLINPHVLLILTDFMFGVPETPMMYTTHFFFLLFTKNALNLTKVTVQHLKYYKLMYTSKRCYSFYLLLNPSIKQRTMKCITVFNHFHNNSFQTQ